MSSLRLALKQSLEEAGPPQPSRRGRPPKNKSSGTGRPRGRPPKRKPGDPPRKRGRPRKHPLPEEEKHEEQEDDDDASSSEAEFSVSHEDSESEQEEQHEQSESSEDEEERRRKQRKMQKKAMKRNQQNSAANKIQSHWKNKRKPSVDETEEAAPKQKQEEKKKEPKKQESSGKAKTVPPPDADLVAYMRGLSVKKQKRNMAAGLRVKVRFATKVRKRDGKVATKLKWYGGLVTRVSTGGSKIRIKYDDGTSEVSKFPDKDVIVDETGNGKHRVSAGRFIPPAQRVAAAAAAEAEESRQEEMEEKPQKKPATPKKVEHTPSKDERKDNQEEETTKPEPESQVSTPPAKSPKKPKSVSAKKRTPASPKRDEEETAASANEEKEYDDHGDSDAKMDDANDDNDHADSDSAPNDAPTKRKKPRLKIRLKGPKASIVASGSHDSVEDDKGHGSSEEEDHGEDSPYEDDAMSVDEEQTKEKEAADDDDEGEDDSVAKSPRTGDESAEEASADDHYARKKRSYDRVSGDEASEEPPKKKRAEETEPESVATEMEAERVEKDEPQKSETAETVDEKSGSDDDEEEEKAPDAAGKDVSDVSPSDRKRKREEQGSPPASPPEAAEPTTPVPAEAKETLSEADDSKSVPSPEDATKVDSEDASKEEDEDVSEVKSSTVDQSGTVPTEDVSKDEVMEEPDSPRAKTPPPVEEEDSKADESTPKPAVIASIPRFGRRAAQQANERIAARKERIIVDEFAKKKKQRKEKADLKLFSPTGRKSKRGDDSDDEVDGNWVQCDNCTKWRILPSSVDTSELPKLWYCEMNVYDPERSKCDAPEQSDQEVLKEKRRRKKKLAKIARLEAAGKIDAETAAAQRLALDNKEKRGRGRPRLSARSPKPAKDSHESEPDASKGKRKKRSSPSLDEDSAQGAESPSADDQPKSKSIKKQSSFGSAGRRSSKSEEVDDAVDAEPEAEPEPVPKKRGRGRPPRARTNKDADKGKSGKSGSSDPDNQEWVACEKCQKWRRLPSHISASSLPDKWYCSMNTWDSSTANCDAAEDKADPSHQEFGNIYGSGVSTASYGNKLSYRNLIFGTGRKQNRPITERTRAAESLFLAPTDPSADSASYPKVMYANSSVFMPRLSNAQKANIPDIEQKMSLFELMNHSNLWAELRAASNAQPDKLGRDVVKSDAYDHLSDETKGTMKEIALYVIGSGTLAGDEVLLGAQCQQWTDVPAGWAEIRASCTIDNIQGALRDLVADGRIETVSDGKEGELVSTTKYRRMVAVRPTRCMKIAKPWKKRGAREFINSNS